MVPIRCDMHFASYPLDRQECHFKIGSVFAEADEELYSGNWTVLDQVGHPIGTLMPKNRTRSR